jgi:hypothetical protein
MSLNGLQTIQHLSYNASLFNGKCDIDLSLQKLCTIGCSSIIRRGTIICSTCLNESSVQVDHQTQYQVITL